MHGENQEKIIDQGQIRYKIILDPPFQSVGEITVHYPEELKREGIASRFVFQVNIKKDGSVRSSFVWKSHYPELEERLEWEVSKMRFKPFIYNGEAIPAHGFMTIVFYPEIVIPQTRTALLDKKLIIKNLAEPLRKELITVLDGCADYCEKLSNSALYYVCLEKINEKIKSISNEHIGTLGSSGGLYIRPNEHMTSTLYQLFLKHTKNDAYVFDYQLVRKYGKINEKRILLGKTGRKISEKNSSKVTKLSHSLQPILAPVHLLSREKRSFYSYKMLDDEKIKEKKVYVIEIYPKIKGAGDIQHGKVWVDKENYWIMKAEVETSYIDGYKEIYEECSKYYLTPHFTLIHHYEIEKNGIMFPSRSKIQIEYSGLLKSKRELKSEAEITYSSYKFFTVEVDHNIIKKKMDEFLLQRDRFNPLILKSLPAIK